MVALVDKPKANLRIEADHSCNWKCCFGCKCVERLKSPKSDTETTVEETVTKVTHVVHKHLPKSPQPSTDLFQEDKYP